MKTNGSPRRSVLFIVPSLRRAGAETQVVELVNALDADRFDKHLAFFDEPADQLQRIDQNCVTVHRYARRSKLDLSLARELARLIDEHHIEVVHCTLQISLFFAFLARLWMTSEPKVVAALHTTLNRSLREELYDRCLFRILLRRCDRIVFVCRAQARHWTQKYPELEPLAEVVYNGVDPAAYEPQEARAGGAELRRRLGIAADTDVISCIAGLRPEKGHAFLFDAFAGLSGSPWLLLAGDGPERSRLEDLTRGLRARDRVCFLGEVRDVRPVISASDVTVLASTAVETFSMAMLESMALEVPVVASDIGGLSEAIHVGETGDLVPAGDASALRASLQRMLDDDDERRQMGLRGRELIGAEFSVQAMAHATDTLLCDMLNDPHRGASRPESGE